MGLVSQEWFRTGFLPPAGSMDLPMDSVSLTWWAWVYLIFEPVLGV